MKRWIAVLVILLAVAPCVRADEASKRDKVRELFVVMKMDSMMEQLTKSIMDQMKSAMDGMTAQDLTASQKKMIDEYRDRMYKLVMGDMGWKALEPDYVEMYANTYTEEEIDGILGFYKSPAGQALLAKTPELMTKSTVLSQQKMAALQPRMRALVDEMVKEMTKSLPPKASTKAPVKAHTQN